MIPEPPLTKIEDRIAVNELLLAAVTIAAGAYSDIGQICDRILDAIDNIRQSAQFYQDAEPINSPIIPAPGNLNHDPVVLWDPASGPVTDSQLRAICEQIKFEQVLSDPEPFEFRTSLDRIITLIANLQLALRHPDNTGPSAAIAHEMATHLITAVASRHPELRPGLEAGWNPNLDLTREQFAAVGLYEIPTPLPDEPA